MSFSKGRQGQPKNLLSMLASTHNPNSRPPLNDTFTSERIRNSCNRTGSRSSIDSLNGSTATTSQPTTTAMGSFSGTADLPEASATFSASINDSTGLDRTSGFSSETPLAQLLQDPPQQAQLTPERLAELEGLRLQFQSQRPIQVGLLNPGNRCYINAVLQTLFSIPQLRDRLFDPYMPGSGLQTAPCGRLYFANGRCKNDPCFICRLTSVGFNIFTSNSAVSSQQFYEVAVNRQPQPQLQPGAQEDVYDLLMVLRTAFEEEMAPNLFDELFRFKIITKKTCASCNHESISKQDYIDLPLDIHHDQVTNILEALQVRLLPTTTIKKHCDHCHLVTNFKLTQPIDETNMPPYMWMKLNRFDAGQAKNMKRVRMSNFIEFTKEGSEDQGIIYRLKAVIYHSGTTIECGHYFAVVRSPDDRTLYKFDDATIPHIVETWKLVNDDIATPYLLLFERVKDGPLLGDADDLVIDLCYDIIQLQRTSAAQNLWLPESVEEEAVYQLKNLLEGLQNRYAQSEQLPASSNQPGPEGLTSHDRNQLDVTFGQIVQISERINTTNNNTLDYQRLINERNKIFEAVKPILAKFAPTSEKMPWWPLTDQDKTQLGEAMVTHFLCGSPTCFSMATFDDKIESRKHFVKIVELVPNFNPEAEKWTTFLVDTAKRSNSRVRKLLPYFVDKHQELQNCQDCKKQ